MKQINQFDRVGILSIVSRKILVQRVFAGFGQLLCVALTLPASSTFFFFFFFPFFSFFFFAGLSKYDGNAKITPVQLDVSKEEDVNACAAFVAKEIQQRKLGGLYGVLQCAGIAFTAPFEVLICWERALVCFSKRDISIFQCLRSSVRWM
jgi:hypothetical protein